MLAFKNGVRLRRLTPELRCIINIIIETQKYPGAAESVFWFSPENAIWIPKVLTVTSINDGKHVPNSKHYINKALDLRCRNFTNDNRKRRFRKLLQERFNWFHPGKFTVILEHIGKPNQHFHIQVKKGERFTGA